ncbi:MAG: SUMF1/EgtB/PvdO family nonheme iron enzyme [Planctomycetota bacterium]
MPLFPNRPVFCRIAAFSLVVLSLTLVTSTRPLVAQSRHAIVIGNSDYEGHESLPNPGRDADLIEQSLQRLGFQVTKKKNLTKREMSQAVSQFGRALPSNSLAFIFFAGHGLQVHGENFLVPVGAVPDEPTDVEFECYSLNRVINHLNDSNASLKVIALDCCRNNPFQRSWGSRSAARGGLASVAPPEGMLISFSTAPGETALDGDGQNSPYAFELANALRTRPHEGLALRDVFFRASRNVKRRVGQVPWVSMEGSLEPYYLVSATRPTPIPTPKKQEAANDVNFASPPPIPVRRTGFLNTAGIKMILIPAGTFSMGSPSTNAITATDTNPRHPISISRSFYMAETEVTQTQWRSVMGTKPWEGSDRVLEGPEYPATHVSWEDAVLYCQRLSLKEQRTYRLPTEAEWEYACRGGTDTVYCFGDEPSALADHGWFHQNAYAAGENHAHRVAQKRPNAFGLFDMHGNVWEWCSDWYSRDFYTKSRSIDPSGPSSGAYRVLRGGCWGNYDWLCGSASRYRLAPNSKTFIHGFRPVCVQ